MNAHSLAALAGQLTVWMIVLAIALVLAYDAGVHRGIHRGFRRGFRAGFTAARKLFARRGAPVRYVSRRASRFDVDPDHADAIDRG